MTDLKIIDELLCIMKPLGKSWADFENEYHIVRRAMNRLKDAYRSGEMPAITLSLAKHFDKE